MSQASQRYFTTIIKSGGFTDQLYQFSTFYKLGLSLGLQYLYTPFQSERTSSGFDVYEFLGFTEAFGRVPPGGELIPRDIEFDDQAIQSKGISSFQELREYTIEKINETEALVSEQTTVFRFSLLLGNGRGFFDHVQMTFPYWPESVDPMSSYRMARKASPWRSRFSDAPLKMVVHMRQGDTALLPTPWGTFLPLFKLRVRDAVQLRSDREAAKEYISPAEYRRLILHIQELLNPERLSVLCFSDGYDRAFAKALSDRNIRRFGLTDAEVAALSQSRIGFDERAFQSLETLPNCTAIIGEGDDNLRDLICSTLSADIIVIGTQQRMLPKLIASYYELDKPKIFVVLHKGTEKPRYDILGLTPEKALCVYHDVEKDDRPRLFESLRACLEKLGAAT